MLRAGVVPGRAGQRPDLLDRLPRHVVDADGNGRAAGAEHGRPEPPRSQLPRRAEKVKARMKREHPRRRPQRSQSPLNRLRGPATAPEAIPRCRRARAGARTARREPRRQFRALLDLDRLAGVREPVDVATVRDRLSTHAALRATPSVRGERAATQCDESLRAQALARSRARPSETTVPEVRAASLRSMLANPPAIART